jgi:large subunit ribosomal protein L19
MAIVKNIVAAQHRTDLTSFNVGDTVKVHQRIKEGEKERVQIFEGLVIARKGGLGANSTFMVRKISNGVGVERIYPVHSPNVVKIEIVKKGEVRSAKLYYVRGRSDNAPRMRTAKMRMQSKAAAAVRKEAAAKQ